LQALGDKSGKVRRTTANAIGRIGDGAETAERLIPLLSDSLTAVRKQTARALGRLRQFTPAVGAALITGMSDTQKDVRRECERALSHLGPAVLPLLEQAFTTAPPATAPTLIRIIGNIGNEAIPVLVSALSHSQPEVRLEAADGLGDLKADTLEVVDSLGDAGTASPDFPDALIPSLRDSSDDLRQRTVEALGEIRVPPHTVVPLLVEALGDPDEDVRESASEILKRLGTTK